MYKKGYNIYTTKSNCHRLGSFLQETLIETFHFTFHLHFIPDLPLNVASLTHSDSLTLSLSFCHYVSLSLSRVCVISRVSDSLLPNDRIPRPGAEQPPQPNWLHPRRK